MRLLPGRAARRRRRITLPRQEAVVHGDGTRHCAYCGDFIDPIDWCLDCKKAKGACGNPHKKTHKRVDAAFCDSNCKAVHRSSFIRDCLPQGAHRA